MIDGMTRLGAKLKIWLTYSSDDRPVNPTENMKLDSMLQREFIELALLESSPDEYCLKNLAGSESTLAITAASTDRDILELILLVIRVFDALNSCEDSVEQIMKIPIEISNESSLLLRTGPVRALVSLGVIRPTADTHSPEALISKTSSIETHLRM